MSKYFTCSLERWPQSLTPVGQRSLRGGLWLHQRRRCPHSYLEMMECLWKRKKEERPRSITHSKEIFLSCYRQTLFHDVLGMTLMRGWSFPAALRPSLCSGGDVTVQKVFSPGASTQANVLRSACVFSLLLASLPQRATWPASFISSAVSLGLQKEDLD